MGRFAASQELADRPGCTVLYPPDSMDGRWRRIVAIYSSLQDSGASGDRDCPTGRRSALTREVSGTRVPTVDANHTLF